MRASITYRAYQCQECNRAFAVDYNYGKPPQPEFCPFCGSKKIQGKGILSTGGGHTRIGADYPVDNYA